MLTLYDYLDSGNGYKARLLLAQLGQPYRRVECDIMTGRTRTPEFLAKNPNGRIPMLELNNGVCLPESNAILWYLGHASPFVPAERLAQSQALQWMFFEQYSHEPYVATPRFILKHLPANSPRRAELPDRLARGRGAQAAATASPTSRCTPTRTWRTKRSWILRRTPRCASGWGAWPRSPGTCRSRSSRRSVRPAHDTKAV